jgi:hypothetical protein
MFFDFEMDPSKIFIILDLILLRPHQPHLLLHLQLLQHKLHIQEQPNKEKTARTVENPTQATMMMVMTIPIMHVQQ